MFLGKNIGYSWRCSKHPILKNEHLANLKHPQSSMEPLNRREPDDYRSFVNTRSAIIKVKHLFNGSTSQRMEKEHLAKLALAPLSDEER